MTHPCVGYEVLQVCLVIIFPYLSFHAIHATFITKCCGLTNLSTCRGRLDGQVHAVLDNVARGGGGGLPGEVGSVRRLADLNRRRRTGETRQTGFEGRNLKLGHVER